MFCIILNDVLTRLYLSKHMISQESRFPLSLFTVERIFLFFSFSIWEKEWVREENSNKTLFIYIFLLSKTISTKKKKKLYLFFQQAYTYIYRYKYIYNIWIPSYSFLNSSMESRVCIYIFCWIIFVQTTLQVNAIKHNIHCFCLLYPPASSQQFLLTLDFFSLFRSYFHSFLL